ncbi:MAG: lamin tail domain-containing protein, partial [Bryocella sp.]
MRLILFRTTRLAFWLAVALGSMICIPAASAQAHSIVISEAYGAGGLSGASYRQDFITLFNPTSSAITANSWAIQIRSSTSTAAFTVYQLPNFTLKPGQYYLITASSPTLSSYGANTPITADYLLTSQFPGPAVSTLNILSSVAQTIALTNNVTPIPAGSSGVVCPAITASNLVDLLGYGSTTGCYAGSGPTSDFATNDYAPSGYTAARSTSVTRINSCVNTNDNSLDFVTTPLSNASFQNSSTALTPCPVTQLLTVGAVNPGVIYPGGPALFTAQVTPSTAPAGTVTSATINLQGIGGPLAQPMYDDGTHGDAVAGDGVYTFNATVGSGAVLGAHQPNVTVIDSRGQSSLAPISFLVTNTRQTAAIHTIQTGAPTNSANNGVVYTTSGIVTGVRARGFYLQAKDADADTDPTTSEGIFVNTGITQSTAAVVGNEVQVTGVLTVAPSPASPISSAAPYDGTELDAPTAISILSTGNPMPTPITITPAMAANGSTYGQRYQYQSMLVTVPSVSVILGTSGLLTETTETYASDGRFYGVVQGTPRPFREPGLSLADPIPNGGPSTVQNFDGNPEALWFDSMTLGGTVINVTTGTAISGVVAIDDYTSGAEQLLLSATNHPTV